MLLGGEAAKRMMEQFEDVPVSLNIAWMMGFSQSLVDEIAVQLKLLKDAQNPDSPA